MQLPCLNWTKANSSSLQVGTQVSTCTLHTLDMLPKKEEECAVRLRVNNVLLPLALGRIASHDLEGSKRRLCFGTNDCLSTMSCTFASDGQHRKYSAPKHLCCLRCWGVSLQRRFYILSRYPARRLGSRCAPRPCVITNLTGLPE